jgi:hypothetical protein
MGEISLEQEQLKEWTHVQSKRNKKGSVKEKPQNVFASLLILSSSRLLK